jgi:hypothetical protein
VLNAIMQETNRALGAVAPIALKTTAKLLNHKSGHVQQIAAADLMDRAGMKPPDKHHHLVAGRVVIDISLGD